MAPVADESVQPGQVRVSTSPALCVLCVCVSASLVRPVAQHPCHVGCHGAAGWEGPQCRQCRACGAYARRPEPGAKEEQGCVLVGQWHGPRPCA